jgi:hypothetical protein
VRVLFILGPDFIEAQLINKFLIQGLLQIDGPITTTLATSSPQDLCCLPAIFDKGPWLDVKKCFDVGLQKRFHPTILSLDKNLFNTGILFGFDRCPGLFKVVFRALNHQRNVFGFLFWKAFLGLLNECIGSLFDHFTLSNFPITTAITIVNPF